MIEPSLSAALDHIDWCLTVPHTVDQVIGIHAEALSRDGRPLRYGRTNTELREAVERADGFADSLDYFDKPDAERYEVMLTLVIAAARRLCYPDSDT